MTKNYPMTTVIAQRTLTWTHKGGKTSEVRISIGTPQQRIFIETGASDWYCPFQVVGIGDDTVKSGLGADSVGALMSALRVCGALLGAAPLNGGSLEYAELPAFGFPTIPDLSALHDPKKKHP